MDAAETYPYIFPPQCTRDAFPYAGLACSRRSYEQQNRAGLLLFEIHHGNLLNDAVLDLFQPVMVFIQDLPGYIKIDSFCIFFLPGKPCDKIQIVIKHAGFHAFLSFLPEPVQYFFRLFSRGFVHAGLRDLFCKALYIRYVFRMHLIQFFLQMLHLPLDCRFAVTLLILLLLRAHGLIGDPPDFHELIEDLFNPFRSFCLAVLCEDSVTFFIGHFEHRGHDAGSHSDGIDLVDEVFRSSRPLQRGREPSHLFKEILQFLCLNGFFKIFRIPPAGRHEADRMVGINKHILQIHPITRPDHCISVLIEFCYDPGNTDGIKTVLLQFVGLAVFFRNDQNHPLSDSDSVSAGTAAKLIDGIIDRGIR